MSIVYCFFYTSGAILEMLTGMMIRISAVPETSKVFTAPGI